MILLQKLTLKINKRERNQQDVPTVIYYMALLPAIDPFWRNAFYYQLLKHSKEFEPQAQPKRIQKVLIREVMVWYYFSSSIHQVS